MELPLTARPVSHQGPIKHFYQEIHVLLPVLPEPSQTQPIINARHVPLTVIPALLHLSALSAAHLSTC